MIGKEKRAEFLILLFCVCIQYCRDSKGKKSDNAIYKCRTKWTNEWQKKKKKKFTPEQFHQHKIMTLKKGKIVEQQ